MSLVSDQIEVIAHLNDVIASLRRKLANKGSGGEKEADRPKRKPRPYRLVQLGALAASGMERQADVRAGEALDSYNAKANEQNIDKELRSLNFKLALEESECARKRAQANADAGREVQVPCPGVVAARDALRSYVERRYTNIGPNSGGGGGGGW